MTTPTCEVPTTIAHHTVKAVLFDMDGTLIDSSPAVAAAWKLLKETGYEFLDLDHILRSAHGYRTIDALRKWCKITDEELLKREVVRFENAILSNAQAKAGSGGGIIALPGVSQLLDDIEASIDSQHATHFYASQALPAAGLRIPKVFVTAESVTQGKPAPDPYLLGAKLNNVSPFDCIVVEDAPTGIRSGKASGALVLATCTSHTRESLERESPDFLVPNLSYVKASRNPDGSVTLAIAQPADRKETAPTPDDTPLHTPALSRVPSATDIFKKIHSGVATPRESGTEIDDYGARGVKAMSGF
ncbi:HAD-like domain-containing protein [Lentinula detonsa]|uniref:HAD-like domain-containing protein n=1 Tax=Lentinula detonsa TaxID=2804962 RepID=A0AA38PT48_9AGAR|nr:HAD-like domain-containing protein [Lentinula detonsa]